MIKKYEEINLNSLMRGEEVKCRMTGSQGIDGSKFDFCGSWEDVRNGIFTIKRRYDDLDIMKLELIKERS